MEKAIWHHLHQKTIDRQKLSGGLSFETWRVTLADGEKYVFRTAEDYLNAGNRMIVAGDIFRRERFFYDTLNQTMSPIFPEVCVIDDSREHYPQAFQIYKWVEGTPLYEIIEDLREEEKKWICHRLGLYVGQMHCMHIQPDHPFIRERGPWAAYMAGRLEERLLPLFKNHLISDDQVRKLKKAALSIKTDAALSFLHLDVRFHNIIYRPQSQTQEKSLFLIDAENAEWGDPRCEIARLALNDMLTKDFDDGYYEATGRRAHALTTGPFLLYQMEVTALVLNVYLYEIAGGQEEAEKYLKKFHDLLRALL